MPRPKHPLTVVKFSWQVPFELRFLRNDDINSAISRLWTIVSLVFNAIIVIAQYARDQAVVSARDQAQLEHRHAVWISENTYLSGALKER